MSIFKLSKIFGKQRLGEDELQLLMVVLELQQLRVEAVVAGPQPPAGAHLPPFPLHLVRHLLVEPNTVIRSTWGITSCLPPPGRASHSAQE